MNNVFHTINHNPRGCAALSPSKLASAISNIRDAEVCFPPLAALEAEFDFRASLNLTQAISEDDVKTSKKLFDEYKASAQYNELYNELYNDYMDWRLKFWNNADGFIVLASQAETDGMLIPFKITDDYPGNVNDYFGKSLEECRACISNVHYNGSFGLNIDPDLLPPKDEFEGGGSFALPILIAVKHVFTVFQKNDNDDRQIGVARRPMFIATGGLYSKGKEVFFKAVSRIEKKKRIAEAIGAFFVCIDKISRYSSESISIPDNAFVFQAFERISSALFENQNRNGSPFGRVSNEQIDNGIRNNEESDTFVPQPKGKFNGILEDFITYLIQKEHIEDNVTLFFQKLFDVGIDNFYGDDVFSKYSSFLGSFFVNILQRKKELLPEIVDFLDINHRRIEMRSNVNETITEIIYNSSSEDLENIIRFLDRRQRAREKVNRILESRANFFSRFILYLIFVKNVQDDQDVLLWNGRCDNNQETIKIAMRNGANAKVTEEEIIHRYSKYLKDYFIVFDLLRATPFQYYISIRKFNEVERNLFKKDTFPSFIFFLIERKKELAEDLELILWQTLFDNIEDLLTPVKILKEKGHEIDIFDTQIINKYSSYLEDFFQFLCRFQNSQKNL